MQKQGCDDVCSLSIFIIYTKLLKIVCCYQISGFPLPDRIIHRALLVQTMEYSNAIQSPNLRREPNNTPTLASKSSTTNWSNRLMSCNLQCVLGCVWATLRVMADPESAPSEFGPRNVRSGVDLSIRVELGRSFRVSYYCSSRCMVLCKGNIYCIVV